MDKQHKVTVILIPVYNDWESLSLLLIKLNTITKRLVGGFRYVIIDDSSTEKTSSLSLPNIDIEIVELIRNVGHQKAIAIGLSYVNEKIQPQQVIVMDADGEDCPEDIPRLLDTSSNFENSIIFAKRIKRTEGIRFKFFYSLYKFLFEQLTGKPISFGNFCLIPARTLQKVVFLSEIWNHFAGGLIRSRFPYQTIPTERGHRLAGESKMNYVSLIMHGLSAISVHIDLVSIRLILSCILLIILTIIGIFGVVMVRIFTELAIPGWATFTGLALIIIVFQAFFICLFLVFTVLSQRANSYFIPANEYHSFIFTTYQISGNDAE